MKFMIDYDIWEHGEYVVTIRPDFEPEWRSIPIGYTLDKKDAKLIARWLSCSLPELFKLFKNVSSESEITASLQ
jgi:hypothetical protein